MILKQSHDNILIISRLYNPLSIMAYQPTGYILEYRYKLVTTAIYKDVGLVPICSADDQTQNLCVRGSIYIYIYLFK